MRTTESESLKVQLGKIAVRPFEDYLTFRRDVYRCAAGVAPGLEAFAFMVNRHFPNAYGYLQLENCPLDSPLPNWSFTDSVQQKYQLKKTYVAEAFLTYISLLFNYDPIGYLNENDGDLFHDIVALQDLKNTHSQKSSVSLDFHTDWPMHYVWPDVLTILALRNPYVRDVCTYVSGATEALALLDQRHKTMLAEKVFYTPHDDYTLYNNRVPMPTPQPHAVVLPSSNNAQPPQLKVFYGRTQALNPSANESLTALYTALESVKKPIHFEPGTLLLLANHHVLHKRAVSLRAQQQHLRDRWLIKTVGVYNVRRYQNFMVDSSKPVVAG